VLSLIKRCYVRSVVSWVHLVGSVTSHIRFIYRGSGDITKKRCSVESYGSRVHLVGCVQYNTLLVWCVHHVFLGVLYIADGG